MFQLPFDDRLHEETADDEAFSFGPIELKLGMILFNCAPVSIATGKMIILLHGVQKLKILNNE